MIEAQGNLKEIAGSRKIPESRPTEQYVLGSFMVDHRSIDNANGIHRECFHQDDHRFTFDAIISLHNERKPIDLLSVMEKLKRDGKLEIIGGPAFLAGLTNRVASTANIEYYATILKQYHLKRSAIEIGSQAVDNAFDESYDSLLLVDQLEQGLLQLTGRFHNKAVRTSAEVGHKLLKQLDAARLKNEGELIGLASGFKDLDKMTNGLHPTDLYILGARPGMG